MKDQISGAPRTVGRSWRTCHAKRIYPTYRAAKKAAKILYQHHNDMTQAYACTVCGGFHVGNIDAFRDGQKLSRRVDPDDLQRQAFDEDTESVDVDKVRW